MKIEKAKISALKLNPANPRTIKDEKFAQLVRSVRDFPEMLEIRQENIEWESDSMAVINRGINGSRGIRMCECQVCGEWFRAVKYDKNRTPKFCSTACYAKTLIISKPCAMCGDDIKSNGASKRIRVYCSIECQSKARRGVALGDQWRANLSRAHILSQKNKGPNAYNWKGGKSTEALRIKAAFYKRKKALKKTFDQNYLVRVLAAQNNQCFFCNGDLSNYKAIEHLTPVSRGGDNDNFNLMYSCKSCNSKKRQMTLEEYAIRENRFDWIDKFDFIYAGSIY